MTDQEIMLALHKMIGPVEWKEKERSCRLILDRAGWVMRRILSEATCEYGGRTGHEAHALIEKAAIEWLIKQVEYFCIEHDTGQSWEVQWTVAGDNDTRVAAGPTLLEALHAAVEAVKESKV